MLNKTVLHQKIISINDPIANQFTFQFNLKLRNKLSLGMVLTALIGSSEAYACASCGCTLSTDWGSQGESTKSGLTGDANYHCHIQLQRRNWGSQFAATLYSSYSWH